jgi:hypothetical protein
VQIYVSVSHPLTLGKSMKMPFAKFVLAEHGKVISGGEQYKTERAKQLGYQVISDFLATWASAK